MSAFRCADCDEIKDSHDGAEMAGDGLICVDCAADRRAWREERDAERALINVGGKRDGGSAS